MNRLTRRVVMRRFTFLRGWTESVGCGLGAEGAGGERGLEGGEVEGDLGLVVDLADADLEGELFAVPGHEDVVPVDAAVRAEVAGVDVLGWDSVGIVVEEVPVGALVEDLREVVVVGAAEGDVLVPRGEVEDGPDAGVGGG